MNLKQYFKNSFPSWELEHLVKSYDIVGDLAIIIIPELLVHREKLIASAILELNKRVKVVLKRAGQYRGEYRQISLEVIGGESRKETIATESGVRLALNPERVYYSVRSSGERKRVANLVTAGERVLVMFSGAAPYPLIISKWSDAGEIIGVEKNPAAHSYGLKSLRLNKKCNNISLYQGDVNDILEGLTGYFDRVIMPLPKSAEVFLPLALSKLKKSGGMIHLYSLELKEEFDQCLTRFKQLVESEGRGVISAELIPCGHCSPGSYRICIDGKVGDSASFMKKGLKKP